PVTVDGVRARSEAAEQPSRRLAVQGPDRRGVRVGRAGESVGDGGADPRRTRAVHHLGEDLVGVVVDEIPGAEGGDARGLGRPRHVSARPRQPELHISTFRPRSVIYLYYVICEY